METYSSFKTGTKLVTSAGTAEQLPPVPVPYAQEVRIKALAGNTGMVYIANSAADAEEITKAYELDASEHVDLKITDLSCVWVNSSVKNEGVCWKVEA